MGSAERRDPIPGDVWENRGKLWTVRSVEHPGSPSGAVTFQEFCHDVGRAVRNHTSIGAMRRSDWALVAPAPLPSRGGDGA